MNNLFLNYKDKKYELEFNGLKIFQTNNPNKFARKILVDSLDSQFSNCNIFKNKIIMINDFTKISDIFSFNKNFVVFKKALELVNSKNIIDEIKINEIVDEINLSYNFDIIENKIDINKIINYLFTMKTDQYLTKDIFLSFLENDFFDESYTFIICDIEWLKIFDVMKFINVHKFIFISNDFRKNINIIKHLEIVVFVNDDILFEILDIDKLISYIESKLNYSLTNEDFKSYIEDSDLGLVIKINEILKKI